MFRACDKVYHSTIFMATEVSESGEEQSSVPCAMHSRENLELYCKDHELALCKICKILKHKKCNVETISLSFQNTDISETLNVLSSQISGLEKVAKKFKAEKQSLLEQTKREKDKIVEKIEYLRKCLNEVLDGYNEQLNSQLALTTENLIVKIQAYESLIYQFETQISIIGESKGNQTQKILSLIEAKSFYKEYAKVMKELDDETNALEIRIMEDEMLQDLIQQLANIGKRETNDSEEILDESVKKMTFIDIKSCSLIQEADIKLPNDEKVPCISGCCFFPGEGVILCDSYNRKIKILDKDMKIKFTVPCPDSPNDVAYLNECSAVIISTSANTLQFISIKPGVKLQTRKQLKHSLYGFTVYNGKIFISCYNNEKEKSGISVLSAIGEDEDFIPQNGPDFRYPQYLSLNSDGSKIFYIGSSNQSLFVTCLTRSGYGIYSVCNTTLKDPRSIVCDGAGNSMVCDMGTKNVHIIDCNGCVGDSLMTITDDFKPTSMCLNGNGDTLIVASVQNNHNKTSKLTVYRLDYKY